MMPGAIVKKVNGVGVEATPLCCFTSTMSSQTSSKRQITRLTPTVTAKVVQVVGRMWRVRRAMRKMVVAVSQNDLLS